jgi:hypothetical protein
MPPNHTPSSIQLITYTFFLILIIFHPFLTGIALGDENLSFSLTLVRKPNAVEASHDYITNIINSYTD